MSKKNNDQNQVPEETKEETPEEVTEASQEKQESSQEEALQQALREQEDKYLRLLAGKTPAAGGVRQLPQAKPEGKGKRLDHRQGGHHQGTAPGV